MNEGLHGMLAGIINETIVVFTSATVELDDIAVAAAVVEDKAEGNNVETILILPFQAHKIETSGWDSKTWGGCSDVPQVGWAGSDNNYAI